VLLEGDARKAVVIAYQERKQEEVTHPLLEIKTPIGLLPMLQARFMARTVRGEMEGYLPYLVK
jgi:CRISPR-associated protein Cas1